MAWIESHQSLGNHPKTKKAARLLGVSKVQVVGHLTYLWWWALDYAQDGNLSRFDDPEIADGAQWEGDAGEFVAAIKDAGFINAQGALNDWDDYAGKLIDRRQANATRMRAARSSQKREGAQHVHSTEHARVERPNRTVPNTTEQNRSNDPPTPLRPESPKPDPKPASPGATAPSPSEPYRLFQALCEETEADEGEASKAFKSQQTGVAKALIADGFGEEDVRRCIRYLRSQSWRSGLIDLKVVKSEIGRWRVAGRPNAETLPAGARASPNGQPAYRDATAASMAEIRRIARGET